MRKSWAFAAAALLISCSDLTNDGSLGDDLLGLQYRSIEIEADMDTLTLGTSVPVKVIGITANDARETIAGAAVWSITPQVAEVTVDAEGNTLIATRRVGTATLQSVFGPNYELTAELTITVSEPQLQTIEFVSTNTDLAMPRLAVGTQFVLGLQGLFSDGSTRPLSENIVYSSSDETVATIDDTGLVSAKKLGKSTITAQVGEKTVTVEVEVYCTYVSSTDALVLGQLSPNIKWTGAYREGDVLLDFSMEEFHCSPEYARYTTINFIIGTGWCPFCPQFMQYVDSISSELDAAGGLIVYVEAQTDNRQPATNAEANEIVQRYIENGPGLRVGDKDIAPNPLVFSRSVEAYPSALVVRRRDLKTIGYQRGGSTGFDFVGMAKDPELSGFVNNCGDSDEEMSEPNDSPDQAGMLSIGANEQAGICNDAPDFYRITHDGAWTLSIEFDHNQGDLDAFVWDTTTNEPFKDASGNRIGSATNNSNESFSHAGPATVRISGFRSASAPYRIKLESN